MNFPGELGHQTWWHPGLCDSVTGWSYSWVNWQIKTGENLTREHINSLKRRFQS